jgi:homoserine dehydrogenase
MATGAVYRIGMLGAGTVGGGVYEILAKRATGGNMLISKICVRSLEKTRDFEIDTTKTTVTTNANDLLSDDIDCLVEVAGGSSGIVKETVLAALKMGKTVVTANKALLAESMGEIQSILINQPSARIGYEAAVCGGIPIVHTLATCYTGDTIHTIRGICNGTTNFMLSAMAKDVSVSYATILQQAQDLGYAEADPTADVEGHDVRAKIALLAQLAFGGPPPASLVDDIPCLGISKLSSLDFAVAAQRQATIKLIGVASRPNDQAAAAATKNTYSVYVTPMMVSLHHTLARIDGSGNCVTVTSNNMPNGCSFAGPGAGRFPTAHSIVADLDRAATGTLPPTALQVTDPSLTIASDYTADAGWYLRFGGDAAADDDNATTATLATLTASAESHQVPLVSVHVHDGGYPVIIVTTGPCSHSTIQAFGAANGAALSMPIFQ